MELAKPPDEPELKNIIDKLANFVARNGPEFENMTKQKQQGNPKFSFLFGGEHYLYYQYKVQTEQAIINVQNKKIQEHSQAAQQQQVQVQQQIQQITVASTPQLPPLAAAPPLVGTVIAPPPAQQVPPQVTPWQSTAPPMLPTTTVPLQETATIQAGVQTPQQQQVASLRQQIQLQQSQIAQQTALNESQVKQSEANLSAQYQSLMQQQQAQIEDTIDNNRAEELKKRSEDCVTSLEDLDKTVQPIIDSCTKDAILSGKSWIFQHCSTDQQMALVAHFLLKRILAKDASFELRLHLIYLINDLLHHCQRKNIGNLKCQLEGIVVPVFCTSLIGAGEDKKVKLNKLLTLWEQNKYFEQDTIDKMKDPDQALSQYHADLITGNGALVSQISASVQLQYQSLQKQHTDFTSHLHSQLQQLQTQLSLLQTQLAQAQAAVITQSITPQVSVAAPTVLDTSSPAPTADPNFQATQAPSTPVFPAGQYGAPGPPPTFSRPPPAQASTLHPPPFDYHAPWTGPPPASSTQPQGPGFPMPDFSKPPPGFPPPGMPRLPPPDIDLTPSVPYFELPAGLMAPLVKLEDHDYQPLDPKDIRLPPPMPPSERLLAAVEAFYSPPFHDRPRDSEGWEKLGLYEFFKAKQKARKLKEQERRSRSPRSRSPRSRSRSPRRRASPPPQRRRRYNSRSPSSSPSPSRSRSRSRSASDSRSKSPLPYRRSSRSPSPRRHKKSRTPESRSGSMTPPNFSTDQFLAAAAAASSTEKLGEENRGHMLLKKMGWGGKGLGAKEQGIVDPIEAADARDKQDMFKGVGTDMKDPFEQFRKNKAQGFISRMQARDDGIKKKKTPDS